MKKNLLRPLILGFGISTLLLMFAAPALAKEGGSPFVGLWQAIDSFDGSTQYLSITCSRREDCDVRLNDTAFTLSCPNQIGFAEGAGSADHNVLTVELTLFCSNLDGTSDEAGSQLNEFVVDHKNGTLVNINDDPGPANVFHKISR